VRVRIPLPLPLMGKCWNGIHQRLKIFGLKRIESSNLSLPTKNLLGCGGTAYTVDSKSTAFGLEGSNPSIPTKIKKGVIICLMVMVLVQMEKDQKEKIRGFHKDIEMVNVEDKDKDNVIKKKKKKYKS
jgi:hypothetical protein